MNDTLLSYYTPSLMKPEDLEAIFVGRESEVADVVEGVRASILTDSKHHALFIGPRGSGKTHIVSMIYHRVSAMEDLKPQTLIAWLREEEWGVTSFLDLLLRIFRSLLQDYPNAKFSGRVDALYSMSANRAEDAAAVLLVEFVGERTLMILMENLDDLFKGLGDQGQRRFRSFLQEHPICTIVATSQSLFAGVSRQRSPFYGFFNFRHLKEFSVGDACQLLTNVARLKGDDELALFIQTPTGRARIRTVHHLAGGNPRLYIIFSHFITRASLDELVIPFMRTLDDLTPYYQSRMAWLSSGQRKIVEFLCDKGGAVPVKEIAQRCFMTHQTTSSQLKALREMNYVTSEMVGRDSYYELHEPLMRICIEVKKNRGEPIQLFVDFLRLWYTKDELQDWLKILQIERPDLVIERTYVVAALAKLSAKSDDPRLKGCWTDYHAALKRDDYEVALRVARDMISIRGSGDDWVWLAHTLRMLDSHEEALIASDRAIELNESDGFAWSIRGDSLLGLERFDESIASYKRVVQIAPESAIYWRAYSNALYKAGHFEESLKSIAKAIELGPDESYSWLLQGESFIALGDHREAIASFRRAYELDPNDWLTLTRLRDTHNTLGDNEEALRVSQLIVNIFPDDVYNLALLAQLHLKRREFEQAITSLDSAIAIRPEYTLLRRGFGSRLLRLFDWEAALVIFEHIMTIEPQNVQALFGRSAALFGLKRPQEGHRQLEDALTKLHLTETTEAPYTLEIAHAAFTSSTKFTLFAERVTNLVRTYAEHGKLVDLVAASTRVAPKLLAITSGQITIQKFLKVWEQLAEHYPDIETSLPIIDTIARYLENDDRRILLALPVEQRTVVEELLELQGEESVSAT
jgi:tetratricopeptide (TPR) repeat protein